MITISIDCAPGGTRPGSYFKYIVNEIVGNSNLSQEAKDYIKKFENKEKDIAMFGNWVWNLEEPESPNIHKEIVAYFEKALTAYYHQGAIRAAGWS